MDLDLYHVVLVTLNTCDSVIVTMTRLPKYLLSIMFGIFIVALALWIHDHALTVKNYSCILNGEWYTSLRLTQLTHLAYSHLKLAEHTPPPSPPLPRI